MWRSFAILTDLSSVALGAQLVVCDYQGQQAIRAKGEMEGTSPLCGVVKSLSGEKDAVEPTALQGEKRFAGVQRATLQETPPDSHRLCLPKSASQDPQCPLSRLLAEGNLTCNYQKGIWP